MLSIEEQAKVADLFYANYRDVEREYLDKIAKQIKDIGKLNASEIKRIEQLAIMNGNVSEITKKLAVATKKSQREIKSKLTQIAVELYGDASKFYTASGVKQVSIEQNIAVQRLISSVERLTGATMANLSHSAVLTQGYTKAVDRAVIAVTSGIADYNSAMRSVIREMSAQGMQTQSVEYTSGVKRRLDSAVRMNVMDAMHSVNIGVTAIVGEEFGSDGVEITSHSNPAPDHIAIDGAVMTNKQYAQFQKTAPRPIGQLNCYHFAFPILLDIHTPSMSKSERDAKRAREAQTVSFGGRDKTVYEWSQEQRRMETSMRYQRDVERMAKISGDKSLYEDAKNKRKSIEAGYKSMSKSVGLDPELERSH